MERISTMNLEEVLERRSQIATEVQSESADLTALDTELDALETRELEINNQVEQRNELLSRVANTNNGTILGGNNMPLLEERTFTLESPEYRSAFFNQLAGNTLTDIEERALSVEGFEGALPTQTANEIYSLIQRDHALLQDIDIYSLGSRFEITVVKSTKTGKAKKTKEGEANVEMTFETVKYTLSGKDYTDWAEISYAMGTMNGQDLEKFLINELYDSIGDVIAEDLVTMIKADVHADNNLTLETINFEELAKAFGNIKAKGEIKTYVNNTSLYKHLVSMVDKEGRPIFQPNANIRAEGAFIGSTIEKESAIGDDEILIGVPTSIVGNWVTKPFIDRDKDIKRSTHLFAGYCRFEAKLRNDLAFVVVNVTGAVGASAGKTTEDTK